MLQHGTRLDPTVQSTLEYLSRQEKESWIFLDTHQVKGKGGKGVIRTTTIRKGKKWNTVAWNTTFHALYA